MPAPNLQALLAPTWAERAAAEDALRCWLLGLPADDDPAAPWPAEIQAAIDALPPDAPTFLSALLGFWAEVCADRWQGVAFDVPVPSSAWASPAAGMYPLRDQVPPRRVGEPGRGHWVWQFFERLGSRNVPLQAQWLACLEHPAEVVAQAAERALSDVPPSTANFTQMLRLLDRGGPRGARRAALLAHCLNHHQLHRLAQPPVDLVAAWLARSQVLPHLPPTWVRQVVGPWQRHWAALPAQRFAELTYGLAAHDPTPHWLDEIQLAASGDADLDRRCAAAAWMARRAPERHIRRLRALAHDHPWVLQALCWGLSAHRQVPTGLLRTIARLGLGNESGFDGEPHDSVLALLIGADNRAEALPEIHVWLARPAEPEQSRWHLREVVRLAEALGEHGRSLARHLPGWRSAAADFYDDELLERLQALAMNWDRA